MKTFRWRVTARVQLARFIQEQTEISGKQVRRLLEQNCCKVNGRIERFGSVWLEKNTVVEFTQITASKAEWTVLFDSADFQIVNKPVNWVCNDANCQKTFGKNAFLVHRLDKDTTGALIIAKTIKARDELIELFAQRAIEKEYLAWVDGVVIESQGTIENFLAKKGSFQGQTIWGASSKGDLAITRWKVVFRGPSETLIRCMPLTGRTHQIRVHMAEMGHPILIDRQYARTFRSHLFATRPLLHAYRLHFTFHGQTVDVTAPLPEDFRDGALPHIPPKD
jgi:RluA family pseudouridine synthase